ncbi:MAG TPA: F0F1 ATP synthase subunit delta [Alphaproteobacteria bacterium]|nr:F0F1 ATP synthase subunit delta [Alphaproteobacteria bacterium]
MPSQSNDAGGVAGRYASALYELADEATVLDAVADDLRALRGLLDESEEFARMVASPVLTRDEQVAAVTALGEKAGFQDLTVKFIGLLARNRRLGTLRSAVAAFLSELAERRGEVTAEVTSAQPMKDSHLEAIKASLAESLGSKVALESRVDPALIGGLVVRVGSKMIDSSLATKLQKLRLSMKGIG